MCAYGVFASNELGFTSLLTTLAVALSAGVLAQLFAFDAAVRGMDLVRPVAALTLAFAPLPIVDLFLTSRFLLRLDLTVVASCCSVNLDGAADAIGYGSGPRELVTLLAAISVAVAVLLALFTARRPTASKAAVSGVVALLALPMAIAACILEVAPHAFEVPGHVCPFCLLKPDVVGLGYALFGAIFLAAVSGVGAAVSAIFARGPAARAAFVPFARRLLVREALAWGVALVLAVLPVARYAIVAGGASLFR
jgi:hypothetical protein